MQMKEFLQKYQRDSCPTFTVTTQDGDIFNFRTVTSKAELDGLMVGARDLVAAVRAAVPGEKLFAYRDLEPELMVHAYVASELCESAEADGKTETLDQSEWFELAKAAWRLVSSIGEAIDRHVSEVVTLQQKRAVDDAKKNLKKSPAGGKGS